jgi:hypothetical protein
MGMLDGVLFASPASRPSGWPTWCFGRASSPAGHCCCSSCSVLTYLLLPRLIGPDPPVCPWILHRPRPTSDGPLRSVNLALLGQEAQVHAAMTRAGWIRAAT